MSRYSQKINDQISYSWGFDHFSGYFFQKFDTSLIEETGDDCEFSISSQHSTLPLIPGKHRYSNGEILEAMEKEEEHSSLQIPKDHKYLITLDLPIP